jgi:sporulation protein YunB
MIVLTVFSTVQMYYYVESHLRPTFVKIAEVESKKMASEAINDSIAKKISEEANYSKLVNLTQRQDGKLTAGYFDLQEATKIQYRLTSHIQEELHHLEEEQIEVPIGVAFDNVILASLSPNVPVRVAPVGHVQSQVGYETKEVGINQTVHVLYLDIQVEVEVIVPFATRPSELHTKVPIAYLVMVGDVPQMVYNSKGETVGSSSGGNSLPPLQLPKLDGGEGK